MSTKKAAPQKAILDNATDCAIRADNADKELTAALMALIGCHQSVTGNDEIDLSVEKPLLDPADFSSDTDTIDRIAEGVDGNIVAILNNDTNYEVGIADLQLSTRLELVQIIRKRINTF